DREHRCAGTAIKRASAVKVADHLSLWAGSYTVVRHRAFLSDFDRLARQCGSRQSNSQQAGLPDGAISGVEALAASGVSVVLRRLATVVFPVVTNDPHSPDPCLVIRLGSVLVGLRCGGILPGYEENQVARRKYGVEDVPGRAVAGPRIQAEPLGAIVRVVGLRPLRGASRVDQRDRCSLADFGLIEPLLRQG